MSTTQPTMRAPTWSLSDDAFGHLILKQPGHEPCEVMPVRAFPIAAPDEGIALVDAFGHEHVWIERLDALPDPWRSQLAQALANRDFTPEIQAIHSVSSMTTPSDWTVQTNRGPSTLRLRSEQDIRRLAEKRLLIADADGLHYLIPDTSALDRASRRLLDHFL